MSKPKADDLSQAEMVKIMDELKRLQAAQDANLLKLQSQSQQCDDQRSAKSE